ncbi:glycosyltransferase family 2 protein [Halomonas sp. BC04]|uniref:glycosyltransferase family 2 protein n=1 Tax=Halomonas sp. BC04 TaxID=1403540 RepID=UPI0009DFEFA9|nr:glycosyltransferase family 2 protein [Halomonas sp. BC04]
MEACWEKYVSVIVPTVGTNAFLSDAIASILGQTYERFELIIVNDAKDPNSKSLVNGLNQRFSDKRLKVVKSHGNGLPAARNTGIRCSTGDIIFFCDDDDVWYPEKVEKQIELMEHHQVDIHLSNFVKISSSGKHLGVFELVCDVEFPSSLGLDFLSPPSGWAIRRNVFDVSGCFDEKFLSTEDKEFILRCSKSFKIVRSGKPFLKYRISDGAISRNIKRKLRFNIALINKYKKDIVAHGNESEGMMRFALKVAIANRHKHASNSLLIMFFTTNASLITKARYATYFILFNFFRKHVKKSVS